MKVWVMEWTDEWKFGVKSFAGKAFGPWTTYRLGRLSVIVISKEPLVESIKEYKGLTMYELSEFSRPNWKRMRDKLVEMNDTNVQDADEFLDTISVVEYKELFQEWFGEKDDESISSG